MDGFTKTQRFNLNNVGSQATECWFKINSCSAAEDIIHWKTGSMDVAMENGPQMIYEKCRNCPIRKLWVIAKGCYSSGPLPVISKFVHPICGMITRFMTLIYNHLKLVFQALTCKIYGWWIGLTLWRSLVASQVASQLGVLQCGQPCHPRGMDQCPGGLGGGTGAHQILLVTGTMNEWIVGLLSYQNGCFMGFNGWLVVTGTWMDYDFPFSWEFHHPSWRTPSFFRGLGIPPTRIHQHIPELNGQMESLPIWWYEISSKHSGANLLACLMVSNMVIFNQKNGMIWDADTQWWTDFSGETTNQISHALGYTSHPLVSSGIHDPVLDSVVGHGESLDPTEKPWEDISMGGYPWSIKPWYS